ncbi:MAG: PAS domain S-box protein [Desulfovibrionales bacterium]
MFYSSILALLLMGWVFQDLAFAENSPGTESLLIAAAEYDFPPFSYVNEHGRADGFAVELLQAVGRVMGKDLAFRVGPWSEVMQQLELGEIEVLPFVGRTPERDEIFDFTFPYISRHGTIVVRSGRVDIQEFKDLKGRRVATMKGDLAEEFLRRNDPNVSIHTTTTFVDALQGLSQGRFDAVIIQRSLAHRLIQELNIWNLKVIDKPIQGFRQDFCFAVKEGNRELLALLNEGLARVMLDGTFRALHSKWLGNDMPSSRRVIIGGDHNYPPFEYLDEKGRPTGFNVELTQALAKAAGIEVEIRLGSWPEIRQALLRGEIDAVQGMLYSAHRELLYDFAPAHTVNLHVSVGRRDTEPPVTLEELQGRRIIVQKGDLMHDYAMQNGLQNGLTVVNSQEEALRQVAEGLHDYALVARLTALYWIKEHKWDNLVVGRKPLLSQEYSYAVKNDNKALLAQLSEGLTLLEKSGEYRKIYQKWMGVYDQSPSSVLALLRQVAVFAIPFFLLLLAALTWSWTLRNQVARKTRELRRSEGRLLKVLEILPIGLWFADKQGKILGGNPAGVKIWGAEPDVSPQGYEMFKARRLPSDEEVAPEEWALAKTIREGRTILNEELEIEAFDGERKIIINHTAPLFDDKGELDGAVIVNVDITERKKAEEEIRELTTRLQHYLTTSPTVTYVLKIEDSSFRLSWVSDNIQTVLGYAPDETTDPAWWLERVHPEDLPRVLDAKSRVFPDQLSTVEYRFFHKDGDIVWLRDQVRLMPEEQEVIGTWIDITLHKNAEEALRRSEEKYRLLADNTLDVIWTMNMDLIFGYVNPSMQRLTGYTPEEVIGTPLQNYCHPNTFSRMAGIIELEIARGADHRGIIMETEILHKDGTPVQIEVHGTIIFDENGTPKALQGTARDISERKRGEIERERLLSAVEQSGEMIVITDPKGVIQYVNQAFETITGFTRDEAIGQSPRILNSGAQDREFYTSMWQTLAAGRQWHGRMVNKRKDGTTFTEEAMIFPIFDASGTILNFVAVKKDISERLLLEAQLQQALKMEAVGRLAGGVAHDYNNMLSVILGYTELAMNKLKPADPLYGDLEQIQDAAKRSRDITRQLLAFARKQTIDPKVINLNQTMEGMLSIVRRLIGEDIELSWMPRPDIWPVEMDPAQLDQILANLCFNARDAIDGVGKIVIETDNVVLDQTYCLNHTGFVSGEYVLLAVSDTGCGMDAKTLERVFEPFFTTKPLGQGTGMGMATVYGIVKQNNGFINVYSEPGDGTTVRIYLPRHEGSPMEVEAEDNGELPHGSGQTILIVEDEPAILEMTQTVLEGLGYSVISAGTPRKAVRLAEDTSSIDLLITDVVMPEMNGQELADRIKSIHPEIKRLYMSGYTANVIANRGVLDDGVNFLQKPFSLGDLAVKVQEVLAQGLTESKGN